MIQLQVLAGDCAGSDRIVRRFPCRLGREKDADLKLAAPGVWERHAELSLDPEAGFLLQARPEALALVNGAAAQSVQLRNGDVIELGGAKLRFWLSRVHQRTFRVREAVTWAGLVALGGAQLMLIYWLVR